MADPDEPIRPGSDPVPLGDVTSPLVRHVALIKLAEEVASFSEQHVVLLEDHRMGIMGMVDDAEAAAKLASAGFEFCSEADKRFEDHRSSVSLVLSPPKSEKASQERAREELNKASAALTGAAASKASPIRIHMVGDLLVSAQEGLAAAREELGKAQLRIEQMYIDPIKAYIRMTQGVHGKSPDFRKLQRSVDKVDPRLSAPLPFFDFISILMNYNSEENLNEFARDLCEKNGISKPIESIPVVIELVQEMKMLARKTGELRHYGKADENTARNARAALRDRRGLFVFGADHGILANNPASLPDQLIQQGKGKTSVRIVQLMNVECAPSFHRLLSAYDEEKLLRPGVRVYDFEKAKKWDSVEEWLKDAPALYGFQPAPSVPDNPPSPA